MEKRHNRKTCAHCGRKFTPHKMFEDKKHCNSFCEVGKIDLQNKVKP